MSRIQNTCWVESSFLLLRPHLGNFTAEAMGIGAPGLSNVAELQAFAQLGQQRARVLGAVSLHVRVPGAMSASTPVLLLLGHHLGEQSLEYLCLPEEIESQRLSSFCRVSWLLTRGLDQNALCKPTE